MADHINIHHPDRGERYEREALMIAELKTKIAVMETALTQSRGDLEAIFTRIKRGDPCELHMMNGDVYVITGALRDDQ
ncbi:hypothetical protein EPK99_06320 [Neorhizobium lilium]|uniref:Uncharacterized protein n=1 Tax=Neorhizobium lilium TaxID=2503024 RepID=A0A3S3SEF3_9HYPH|nr:hypothetical protein [Neorhizobium lilium]RWX78247.1 hypothetical protein EPK99_06320 [Neorhizobium lilium]